MITWRKEDSNNQKGKLYMSMWLYMIVHCTVHFRSTSTINTSVKKKLVEEILATPNCSYSEDAALTMTSTSNSETSSKKMVLCGHCNDYVAKRTYYQHRRLYFDTRSREWSDKRVFNHVDVEVPFNLEHRQSSLHSPSAK